MGLFNKKNKEIKKIKVACNCNKCELDSESTSRFIVLGACCKKSLETFENTKQAVSELGYNDEVLNIGDEVKIAGYGVMSTPALVIDGKVVSYGKALSVNDVKKLIENI